MKRAFKVVSGGWAAACHLLPGGTVVEVKDWLRNRDDYIVWEGDMSDVEAVEFMLRMDGLAEPTPLKRPTIFVEDELPSVFAEKVIESNR